MLIPPEKQIKQIVEVTREAIELFQERIWELSNPNSIIPYKIPMINGLPGMTISGLRRGTTNLKLFLRKIQKKDFRVPFELNEFLYENKITVLKHLQTVYKLDLEPLILKYTYLISKRPATVCW